VNNWVTNCFDWLGAATHTYNPENVTYGSPEIVGVSYNSPDGTGSAGGYIYTFGITVTLTARRTVTYEVVCPDECEMNGTTKTTDQTFTQDILIQNTIGEIVTGVPAPFGFNPISFPTSIIGEAFSYFVSQVLEGALASQFSEATQTKINNAISAALQNPSAGWTEQPVDFGECAE
jgi:hypothetical protein